MGASLPESHRIRIYVRYEVLYLTELRSLLNDLESAYNQITNFVARSKRVSRKRRLQIESVNTGQSIEVVLSGYDKAIVALSTLILFFPKLRQLFWSSEFAKWQAKAAKQEFEDKERDRQVGELREAMRGENPHVLKATRILERRITLTERSKTIQSVEFEVLPSRKGESD
jgi:hypothetical protein